MRKQKHLDDLMAQVAQLRKDNNQILTSINITTQHYMNLDSENSILKAQLMELNQRLDSLNEIVNFISTSNNNEVFGTEDDHDYHHHMINTSADPSFLMNPMNMAYLNQPIMAAAADMFQY